MSKKSQQAEAAAAEEDRLLRILLAEQDAHWEAQAAASAQRTQRLLAEERQQLAADRLERQAQELATYRQQAIAAAVADKSLAPQLAAMISTDLADREAIDNAVQLGIDKTQEILTELAGQHEGELSAQARDESTGRFIPAPSTADPRLPQGLTAEEQAAAEDGSLTLRDYAAMRARLGLAGRDAGIFG